MTAAASTIQDTGKFRTNLKDQYYTCPAVAAACVARILLQWPDAVGAGYHWIEPAAGEGVFLTAAAGVGVTDLIAMDIDPPATAADIQKRDFLTWMPAATGSRYMLFGNPPFGRQGSVAKRFIQHGATFADRIAFILPRSFQKPSMSRAFPPDFHCVWTEELAADSFVVNGAPHSVPCVFQLWERRVGVPRPVAEAVEPVGFTYVTAAMAHDLVVRRVGVRAGAASVAAAGVTPSPQSHYFLRLAEEVRGAISVADLAARVSAHVFPSNTTGPRSLSKSEINTVINGIVEDLLTSGSA
jgi:hypothetical protein